MLDRNEVRACNPAKFEGLLETSPGSHKFAGGLSTITNRYLFMMAETVNITPVFDGTYPGVGSRIGDSDFYDGCLGQLQRGETDIMVAGMDYPVDLVNVTKGMIFLEEKTAFIGVFPRPQANNIADFARSIYSFHWSVYLLILIFLLIFNILFEIRHRIIIYMSRPITIRKKKKSVSFYVPLNDEKVLENDASRRITILNIIRHYLRASFIEANSSVVAVLIMVLNIFSFVIFAYLNSLLNTDLVVPEKVIMHTSYDEMMKTNVKPIFVKGTSYYEDLKFAPEESKSKLFWNWAVAKYGEENLLSELNHDAFMKFVEFLKGDIIILTGEKWLQASKIIGCDFLGRSIERLIGLCKSWMKFRYNFGQFDFYKFSEAQIYIKSDESATKKIKELILGKRVIESKELFSKMKLIFKRCFEFGFFDQIMRSSSIQQMSNSLAEFTQAVGPPAPERSEIKHICLDHNSPFPKTPRVDRVIPSHFKITFIAYSALIFIAFVRFLYEIKCKKITRVSPAIKIKSQFST